MRGSDAPAWQGMRSACGTSEQATRGYEPWPRGGMPRTGRVSGCVGLSPESPCADSRASSAGLTPARGVEGTSRGDSVTARTRGCASRKRRRASWRSTRGSTGARSRRVSVTSPDASRRRFIGARAELSRASKIGRSSTALGSVCTTSPSPTARSPSRNDENRRRKRGDDSLNRSALAAAGTAQCGSVHPLMDLVATPLHRAQRTSAYRPRPTARSR